MNSLSGAMLAGSSSRLNTLLYVICLVMVTAIVWAYFAELDERTRGIGRTIPSQQIQVVQNLEGGIIKEIHVVEGQFVRAGEILVTIDDTGVGSSHAENANKIKELSAKSSRLRAEAGVTPTLVEVEGDQNMTRLMDNEKRLYAAHLRQYENQQSVLQQQLQQRQVELLDAEQDLKSFKTSQSMINREIQLSRPLLKKKSPLRTGVPAT